MTRRGCAFLAFAFAAICWPGATLAQVDAPTFQHEVAGRTDKRARKPSSVPSKDGERVLRVQPNKTVRLFDAKSDEPAGPEISLSKPGLGFLITALAIAPDNKTIATAIGNYNGDWGQVEVWNATSGAHLSRYEDRPSLGRVYRVSFSEDGKKVSIVSGPPGGR